MLDGAILVLCAVAGVQVRSAFSQQAYTLIIASESNHHGGPTNATLWRSSYLICEQNGQVRRTSSTFRYLMHVRPGANPWRIVGQIRSKLRIPAAAVQVPIGVEDGFKGVVDLVYWKSIYNEGQKGCVGPYNISTNI